MLLDIVMHITNLWPSIESDAVYPAPIDTQSDANLDLAVDDGAGGPCSADNFWRVGAPGVWSGLLVALHCGGGFVLVFVFFILVTEQALASCAPKSLILLGMETDK
ncbi:hypothetical protein K458DRAFT_395599 [Lentithecium fluviatile CBS 122367]|uniref:Uncharacterized protein n=1 Tax=Lentithecium fluviatile CBS 122367 TaxID=1168545 RepID=A0A6G1IHT7_9PLEO|nr:hypothetical protein K458DRAFT_395599 [Lentithecium fluviatile CBS 122367]